MGSKSLELFLVNHVGSMELQIIFLTLTLISVKTQVYNGCEYTQLYRHPANCHLYLQCSMGYEYIMNCNEDLVFNEKMQYCDWDYNVPECYEEGTTTSILTTTKSNCVEVHTYMMRYTNLVQTQLYSLNILGLLRDFGSIHHNSINDYNINYINNNYYYYNNNNYINYNNFK